jgi:hypothetical protein
VRYLRRSGTIGPAVALVAAVALVVVASGEGAHQGGNGMIAYANRVPGFANEWSVHTLNPDGTGEAMLVTGGANGPWSPDGNKLLFSRFPSFGSADIYVVNTDGSGEQQLTSGFPAWSPSWSPDGTRIAYKKSSASNSASGEFWTMNADGTDKKQITNDGLGKFQLSWGMSPSGSKIAYAGFRAPEGWGMFTINPDGSGLTRLTGVPSALAFRLTGPIDWSPDGTKIVFSSESAVITACGISVAPEDIYVYTVLTNTTVKVSNTSAWEGPHEFSPAWSPDGSKIAFSAVTRACNNGTATSTAEAIYSMNADGSGVTKLTNPPIVDRGAFGSLQTYDVSPAWQPCRAETSKCTSVSRPPPPPPLQSQSITFAALANRIYGDPDFTVTASASSGLAVSFATSGNCTVSGAAVHLTGAGSCTVTASQPGNTSYSAAPPVSRTFSIAKANQTITFDPLTGKTFGDADFTVNASASSGLPVSYSTSGTCTITASTVHLIGPGSCTATASQPGDANYNAAPDVARTFAIAPKAELKPPVRCTVPRVVGKRLVAARSAIKRGNCRVGTTRYAYSSRVKKGAVIAQSRSPRKVLPAGSKISLVVSRGRKP